MPHAHFATPRSTARTAAKAVVTQIMFRRFDVMTANSPGCSNAFQDTFLRGLICCLVTGFLCAMAISVSGAPALEMPEAWLPSLTGLGDRVSSKIADATEETLNRGSYRALNSPLDLRGIAATFSIWAFHAHWDKGSGWARSPLSCAHTILVLVGFDGFTRRLTRTIIEFQGIS
jgi:hypothetical protein